MEPFIETESRNKLIIKGGSNRHNPGHVQQSAHFLQKMSTNTNVFSFVAKSVYTFAPLQTRDGNTWQILGMATHTRSFPGNQEETERERERERDKREGERQKRGVEGEGKRGIERERERESNCVSQSCQLFLSLLIRMAPMDRTIPLIWKLHPTKRKVCKQEKKRKEKKEE